VTFYTYLWLRDDGTPYYAGKGKGNRAFSSMGHRVYKPPNPENIIVQEWPDEASAFEGEKLLIAIYGRKDLGTGILRNLTDGGEGFSNPSEEKRQAMRVRNLGRINGPHSEQTRLKIGAGNRGKKRTDEERRINREARIGKKMSEEHRRKTSEGLRGKKRGPLSIEHRVKISAGKLGWAKRSSVIAARRLEDRKAA
jgi:hypothetical protein